MNDNSFAQTEFPFTTQLRPKRRNVQGPKEFKAVSLRTISLPDSMQHIETPDAAHRYWRMAIETGMHYTADRECCYVIALNARKRVLGHYLVAFGTLNSIHIHCREVFRIGILVNAFTLVLMHNHPSGDCSPSDADIRITRELIHAGELLYIRIQDHVIVGAETRASLRELGFFH